MAAGGGGGILGVVSGGNDKNKDVLGSSSGSHQESRTNGVVGNGGGGGIGDLKQVYRNLTPVVEPGAEKNKERDMGNRSVGSARIIDTLPGNVSWVIA